MIEMLKKMKRVGTLTLALMLTLAFTASAFAVDGEVSEAVAEIISMTITIEEEELELLPGEIACASDIIVPQGEVNALVVWSIDNDKYVCVEPSGLVYARTIVYYDVGPVRIGLPNFGGKAVVSATTLDGLQCVNREVVVKRSFRSIIQYINAIIVPHETPEELFD